MATAKLLHSSGCSSQDISESLVISQETAAFYVTVKSTQEALQAMGIWPIEKGFRDDS